MVKNPPVVRETWVLLPEWEDRLEKGTATTPVFWPGEFHGLYGPWGCKESGMTEWLSLSTWLLWQWKCCWDTSWNRFRDDKKQNDVRHKTKWNQTKSPRLHNWSDLVAAAAINIQPLALNKQTGCFPEMLACEQKLDVPSNFQTCGISTNG